MRLLLELRWRWITEPQRGVSKQPGGVTLRKRSQYRAGKQLTALRFGSSKIVSLPTQPLP
jgi:hypothetical protein